MMTKIAAARAVASPLNNPYTWGPSDGSCPFSDDEVASYQARIDSIIGTSNGNSIVKLVWNGDRRFWRDICVTWDSTGKAIEFAKRPIVLFRTIFDAAGKRLFDVPPPRWLLLTRLEPEQYVHSWARESKVWMPDRKQYVQVKPETPPPDGWYIWFMTIADHDKWCCQHAAKHQSTCYGSYADPGRGLKELERIRAGMEGRTFDSAPFDRPDRLTRKLRENGVNNYVEQAIKKYDQDVTNFIDRLSNADLRQALTDDKNRDLDELVKIIGAS